jgi:hypothetical protein
LVMVRLGVFVGSDTLRLGTILSRAKLLGWYSYSSSEEENYHIVLGRAQTVTLCCLTV